jgi:hypothetical protein
MHRNPCLSFILGAAYFIIKLRKILNGGNLWLGIIQIEHSMREKVKSRNIKWGFY